MVTYSLTKKDLKKVANQLFVHEMGGFFIFVIFSTVFCLYGVLAKYVWHEDGYNAAVPSLIVVGIGFAITLLEYCFYRVKFARYTNNYAITYNSSKIYVNCENTSKEYEGDISTLSVYKQLKSFVLCRFKADKRYILIVPKNDDTKEFLQLFTSETSK